MHHQRSLPTFIKCREEQAPIKSLLQQAYLKPSAKKERNMTDISSWSIPLTPAMPYDAMSVMNAINIDNNLPGGAYYGELVKLVKFLLL